MDTLTCYMQESWKYVWALLPKNVLKSHEIVTTVKGCLPGANNVAGVWAVSMLTSWLEIQKQILGRAVSGCPALSCQRATSARAWDPG